MADRKRASAEDLFEKYRNEISVEEIDFAITAEPSKLDYAPAFIKLSIPDEMIKEYARNAKIKTEYPPENDFIEGTNILEKLRSSGIKVRSKHWNNLGDVLDFLKTGAYTAKFQKSDDDGSVILTVEEIVDSKKADANAYKCCIG